MDEIFIGLASNGEPRQTPSMSERAGEAGLGGAVFGRFARGVVGGLLR